MFPNPYKIPIYLVLTILILAFTYYEGYSREHDKLITYQATIEANAVLQNKQNVLKEKEQNDTTTQITTDYSNTVAKLNSALRLQHTSSNIVPKPTSSIYSVNGPKPEQSNACTDTFYANALEDVVKLNALQDWINAEGLNNVSLVTGQK
jgi:hypothetical protein